MELTPWTADKPARSPFALPRGRPGRLAGRLKLLLSRQQEVACLLDVQDGAHILEIGYGPGALIGLLRQTPAGRVCGVDPSPQMRDLAQRRNPGADLRIGTAARTGFGDGAFDRVVSVNTVALWPDLRAGLKELNRVTRPGGRVLIAWHGGQRPSLIARRLALPEDVLCRIEQETGVLFTGTTRHELAALTAFTATRPPG
jgi:SAM-dependent methyltransferase